MLVGYENEAIQAQKDGMDLEYVTPDTTILIENPIAVTTGRADRRPRSSSTSCTRTRASRSSPTRATARSSSPCVDKNADKFPTPSGLFTIAEFGGWAKVYDEFFGDNGSVIQVEQDLGTRPSRATGAPHMASADTA